MTGRDDLRTRKIVVVGTTFGRMYLEAIRRSPTMHLAGLVARGSRRSHSIAAAYGVPLLTSTAQVPGDTDLACVAVRAGSIGGEGTTVAVELLSRGISVLQELPAGSGDVTACLRAAHHGRAAFAVANLYRRLPSVRAFLAAAQELVAAERPLAVDAHLSIQPAYALADILTQIGIPVRPVSLASVGGGSVVAGTLGRVPVAVRYATALDSQDTDNDVRFPAVSVHTGSGTLTLTDVHGPVLWIPTLHLPSEAKHNIMSDTAALREVSATDTLFSPQYSHAAVLDDLWPKALAAEIDAALQNTSTATGQRTLQVAQLWQTMTSGVDFPVATDSSTDFTERAALLARLRKAAGIANPEPATADEEEDQR